MWHTAAGISKYMTCLLDQAVYLTTAGGRAGQWSQLIGGNAMN